MATRFQAVSLVASPSYHSAVAWSDENIIAVASGHLVTILNPVQLFGPKGLVVINSSTLLPFGVVERKDLFSSCLLPTCVSREPQACVRSISWSPIGFAPNAGCLLSVCTTEGRVKLYRMPYCEFSAEWVEVCDISELLYSYFSSVNFLEDSGALVLFTELENQPASYLTKEPKRRRKNSLPEPDNAQSIQFIPMRKCKAKPQNETQEGTNPPLITANQYASRNALLSSLVVGWSPIIQSLCQIGKNSTNSSSNYFSILAVGGKSGRISFWRIDKMQYFSPLSNKDSIPAILIGILQAHSGWVTAISWSLFDSDKSNSQLFLATGSSDGSVKIWMGYTAEQSKSSEVNFTPFSLFAEVLPANFVPISVVSLIVSKTLPNRMHLAVGKGSGSFDVFICNLATSANKVTKIGSYEAHNNIVTGLVWAFDGSCLYSCSQDNSVHSWNLIDNTLSEVPIPLNPLDENTTDHVPKNFDLCFGLAVSPGNMVIAVVRSFDAESLNPMYQQRSQKAAVEFFWIGGQQIGTEFDFEVQGLSSLSQREIIYWKANLLWSLNQYKVTNKPLVVWDIVKALSIFKQCSPEYVESLLSKWLVSFMGNELDLTIREILSEFPDLLPRMSSRELHILNIIIRRAILTEMNADEINLKQANQKGLAAGEDKNLPLWLDLLFSSEKELRKRLLVFSFSTILNLRSQPPQKTSCQYQRLVGIAQMEQWLALNRSHINDHLESLSSDVKDLQLSKLQKICDYVPEEQCSFCSAPVPFESSEVGFCRGDQSHKLLRCGASMKVCPLTPTWFCMCCRRRVSNLPPSAIFNLPCYPLDFEFSNESFRLDLHPTPLCPFCGILLQRLQPEFLLSVSPV